MIWHPFTSLSGEAPPLKIVRGRGEYLYDAAGKEYVDAIASWWAVIHGHNHPDLVAAVRGQLEKLDHVLLAGFTHEPAEKLAAKLLELTAPDFTRVFYSDNGSTAVEVMLKLAVQYWQICGETRKTRFVKFEAAYHGDTAGAMSVGGASVFNRVFAPLLFEAKSFPYPAEGAGAAAILRELDDYLQVHAESTAGIILEPLIAAAGGMVFQGEDTFAQIAMLAEKHRVLLLLDEVFTGIGRTGAMFAYRKAKVKPDLVALAKGLTGGMLPLAVTLVSEKIRAAFNSEEPARTFYHGHTMTGYPSGSAVALASLQLLESESRLAAVAALEGKMRLSWQRLFEKYPEKIAPPRVMGAVSAANLRLKAEPGYVFAPAKSIRAEALAAGVILRPLGNVIYITPPYNISDAALEKIFAVIGKILDGYHP